MWCIHLVKFRCNLFIISFQITKGSPPHSITLSLSLSGIVVALHGKETSEGDFFVQDMLEAGLPPQTELPLSSSTVLLYLSLTLCLHTSAIHVSVLIRKASVPTYKF